MTDTTNTLRAALQELVTALDETNWSSWQTTAPFASQHEAARAALAANPAPEQAQAVVAKPVAPKFCLQCGSSSFRPEGRYAAFQCVGCGDVAHWLSPEWRAKAAAAIAAAPPVAPAQSFLHKPSGMTFDTVIAAVDESAIVELGESPVAPAPGAIPDAETVRACLVLLRGLSELNGIREAPHWQRDIQMIGDTLRALAVAAPAAVPALRDMIQMVLDEARKGGSDEEVIAAVQWRMPAAAVPAEPFTKVRSIIHKCPAIKLPQSFLMKLGNTAQLVVLKGADDELADELIARLNAAPTPPQRQPLTEAEPTTRAARRCGDCRLWMKKQCPRERHNNQVGRSFGPASLDVACVQWSPKP